MPLCNETIYLVLIFDKAKQESISKKDIDALLKNAGLL